MNLRKQIEGNNFDTFKGFWQLPQLREKNDSTPYKFARLPADRVILSEQRFQEWQVNVSEEVAIERIDQRLWYHRISQMRKHLNRPVLKVSVKLPRTIG